ncbi:MAG: hypothetical protein GXO82_06780 [Chlorobi bacterium]|nr:hypothetical protein [Chlorobiota bacterium]
MKKVQPAESRIIKITTSGEYDVASIKSVQPINPRERPSRKVPGWYMSFVSERRTGVRRITTGTRTRFTITRRRNWNTPAPCDINARCSDARSMIHETGTMLINARGKNHRGMPELPDPFLGIAQIRAALKMITSNDGR